jgi:hypothetical protein
MKYTQTVPVMDYCFLWYSMSRVGEWDCPRRGFQQYFDRHVDTLKKLSERYYLPGQFGWLALCPSASEPLSAFQCPPMHVEDTRYLAAKALAHDYGLSFLDVSLGQTQPLAFKNGVPSVQRSSFVAWQKVRLMCIHVLLPRVNGM